MTIGERLREERLRIGVNQTVLAETCGVTKNTQLAYEKGDRKPDTSYLEIAAGLGMDVLFIVTGERRPVLADTISAEEAGLLEHYRKMAVPDRDSLLRMAHALANMVRPPQDNFR